MLYTPTPATCFQLLQVLACLTILGRGNCFASIYQMSWMSGAVVQATFHSFCSHFAREMYDEHIYLPTKDHLDHVMGQYDKLGFTGAVGSTDVTHIAWSRCPYNQARSYTGKEGIPTVGYQVTVDHAGRALAVTGGFTGSTNDKTIICCDAAVDKIRFNPTYTEKTFVVFNEDGTTYTLKGCYLLVDNGYSKVNVYQVPSTDSRGLRLERTGRFERMCLVLPPSPYSSNQILYLGTGYVICFARVVTFSVGVRSMHAELA